MDLRELWCVYPAIISAFSSSFCCFEGESSQQIPSKRKDGNRSNKRSLRYSNVTWGEQPLHDDPIWLCLSSYLDMSPCPLPNMIDSEWRLRSRAWRLLPTSLSYSRSKNSCTCRCTCTGCSCSLLLRTQLPSRTLQRSCNSWYEEIESFQWGYDRSYSSFCLSLKHWSLSC